MSDLPIQTNGTHQHIQEANGSNKNSQVNSNPQNIEIQVTTKKKKQVINLQSSSERARSKQGSSPKPADLSVPKQSKKTKVKKSQHKCQLCKANGKKVQMKKCTNCKHYTHLHCLDQNQGKGKYTCDRCKAAQHSQESKTIKKQKKLQQKIEQNRASQKKIEKEKRKDQSHKILQKMKEKYPYYIGEGDKIKFPIQDKLLFIYKQYFEVSEPKITPTNHPLIPSQHLGDLLQIQNFISSFGRQIEEDYNGDFRKSVLYVLMNCKGSDKTFEQLLGALIKIYLKDIFQKNKTENVKILNDNAFFILLGTINEAQQMTADYVAMTAPQIIRNLSTVPSMRNSFKDFRFPQTLSLQTKLKIIVELIQGLSQVDGFHDMVSRKSEKISQMTKDKADSVVKLKKNQAEALSNKEKLKQFLGKNNKPTEDQNQAPQQQVPKDKAAIKELQKLKKKTQKLATQGEHSQKIIKQFKSKIVEITRKIPFVISQVLFLGVDRNNSSYYFYLKQPHRIYVCYHNFLLDDHPQFKIFETKQKIQQFLKSLNTKGVHQKRLYESIHNLIKQQIIRNLTLQDDLKQTGTDINQPMAECVFMENDSMFRQRVINDVMDIQEKFSNYLTIKSYRWANDTRRQQFRFGFPYIQDIQALKEQIKNLQQSFLFVEVIKQKQIIRADESDSNQEIDKEQNQSEQKQLSRRKKPIRIWGINSQRIKKFWVEYLQSCINYTGIWISVSIFKNYVDKYLEKKMQHIREQQRKQNYLRQKQLKQRKLRQQKQRQKQQRNLDRLRSRDKPKLLKKHRQVPSYEDDQGSSDQGVRTRRHLRTNRPRGRPPRDSSQYHHRAKLTIDSDEQYENNSQQKQQQSLQQIQIQQQQHQQQSQNDDQCAICHDIGQVICCDTCPKVFHLNCLGLKQTPQGQWSCIDCLHKINNQRQTRSRAKKMGK